MEQLDYNLLFCWLVGLNPDDTVRVLTTFSKNRDRLLDGEIAEAFCEEVLEAAEERHLLSHEHFSVDGTLLEAWARVCVGRLAGEWPISGRPESAYSDFSTRPTPATMSVTSRATAAMSWLARPSASRYRRPSAVGGTMPSPTSLLTKIHRRGV